MSGVITGTPDAPLAVGAAGDAPGVGVAFILVGAAEDVGDGADFAVLVKTHRQRSAFGVAVGGLNDGAADEAPAGLVVGPGVDFGADAAAAGLVGVADVDNTGAGYFVVVLVQVAHAVGLLQDALTGAVVVGPRDAVGGIGDAFEAVAAAAGARAGGGYSLSSA